VEKQQYGYNFWTLFEVTDDGKISAMTTYDDTLTAFNSMKNNK